MRLLRLLRLGLLLSPPRIVPVIIPRENGREAGRGRRGSRRRGLGLHRLGSGGRRCFLPLFPLFQKSKRLLKRVSGKFRLLCFLCLLLLHLLCLLLLNLLDVLLKQLLLLPTLQCLRLLPRSILLPLCSWLIDRLWFS